MVRVRKLVLAIAAASALSSGVAHALGLGEVSLKSSLNQPLSADIELFEVRDLSAHEITPKLASPEEFAKAGIDRQFFLSDLTFTPVIKPNGQSVIRVTSNKAVREPYLNFLVEVNWPNGRLLREYTLLLDPPLYSPQTTAAAAPQLATATAVQPPVAAPASVRTAPSAPARKPVAPISADQYKVERNDTLWEIARRVGGGSVHQTMLAIVDLNPDAFIGGNINRMKSGQVLRLPDAATVQARSASEAVAQVAEHNAAWREGRAIAQRQIDATHRSETAAAPATAPVGDTLKLVAADAGQAVAGSDKGSVDSAALADKLAVTQEALDSTRRENAELKSRLDDLQRQLELLQKLVAVKDNQFAQMQAAMAEADKEAPAPIVTEAGTGSGVNAAAADQTEVAPVDSGDTPSAAAAEDVFDEPDFNYSEEPVAAEPSAPVAEIESAGQATEEVAPEPVVSKPVESKQAPATEPVATTSLVDDILANPTALGVAGGSALLLLLVGLMALSRRNASKEAELQAKLAEEGALDEPFAAEFTAEEDAFEGLAQEPVQPDEVPTEPVTAQTGDALAEADIYIAYGRFNQAAELLNNAINEEPQRSDLRLKLMEVYAELGDRAGFVSQENELREIGGAQTELEQVRARYPAMAAVGAVASAGAVASINELAVDEGVDAIADDLSFDDLDIDLELDDSTSEPADVVSTGDELSLDLEQAQPVAEPVDEFDLSLDELEASSSEPVPLADELADFSLDLEEEAASNEASVEASDVLDFALDEPLAESEPAGELSLDLPADFDLSLDEPAIVVAEPEAFAAKLEDVSAQLDEFSAELQLSEPLATADEADVELAQALDAEDDFDFLSGTDEAATKLDLARAYIDMGDAEGARDILEEVVAEGNDTQQQEAREMIAKLV